MKRFKFRLERVLHYREMVKDEKKRELAKINMKLREQQDHLRYLMDEQLANEVEAGQVMDVNRFLMAGLYGARLKAEIAEQHLAIEETEKEVAKRLAEYVEASKDHKALDTLKKRRNEQYMEYVAKEEEKFLDELVIQRIGNKRIHQEDI